MKSLYTFLFSVCLSQALSVGANAFCASASGPVVSLFLDDDSDNDDPVASENNDQKDIDTENTNPDGSVNEDGGPTNDSGGHTPDTGEGEGTPDTGEGEGTPGTGEGEGTPGTGEGGGTPDTGEGDEEPDPEPTPYELAVASMDEKSIPLVNIVVDLAKVNAVDYVPALFELADTLHRTCDSLVFSSSCLVRYRGSSSLGYDKKNFAVKLTDENGEDRDTAILGIRPDDSWILNAMAIDRARLRNKLCFDVWNSFSRTPYDTDYDNRNGIINEFVEVYLNGEYHGLYCISDKVDRKLLNLKKPKVEEVETEAETVTNVTVRGLLYKCVEDGWGSSLMWYDESETNPDYSSAKWLSFELKVPEEYPSEDTWLPLKDLLGLYHEYDRRIKYHTVFEEYFYKQNTMDYAALVAFFNIRDNTFKNVYFSIPNIQKAHVFLMTPWDMDTSLGGTWTGGYDESYFNVSVWMGSCAPYKRMYTRNYFNYANEFDAMMDGLATTVFAPEAIFDRIDNMVSTLTESGAWAREQAKWNGNPVPLTEDLNTEVDYVKNWYVGNYQGLGYSYTPSDPAPDASVDPDAPPTSLPSASAAEKPRPLGVFSLSGVRQQSSGRLSPGVFVVNGRLVLFK